jgi:hypothetical protein
MPFPSARNSGTLPAGETDAMHAHENYRPTRVVPTAQMAFRQWTERVAAQPEFVSAREMSGLADEHLAALAAEFEQAPRAKRTDVLRWASPLGGLLLVAGAFAFVAHFIGTGSTSGLSLASAAAASSVILGFVSLGIAAVSALQRVPTEAAYGKVGLLVGQLDEQHPWLYRTLLLMRNAAADAYRRRVLAERGPLRGVDYLMMREIASAHENMELTQTARSVRDQVQAAAAPGDTLRLT